MRFPQREPGPSSSQRGTKVFFHQALQTGSFLQFRAFTTSTLTGYELICYRLRTSNFILAPAMLQDAKARQPRRTSGLGYSYDAKFSAISIKVENIYFRKKIGIKNRKKIGRKNTLDTGLQSTSQYICFPIFSYVFPICIFGPCFFLFLNPIFLIFPISEHLLPAPYLFFFLFSPIFPMFFLFFPSFTFGSQNRQKT